MKRKLLRGLVSLSVMLCLIAGVAFGGDVKESVLCGDNYLYAIVVAYGEDTAPNPLYALPNEDWVL